MRARPRLLLIVSLSATAAAGPSAAGLGSGIGVRPSLQGSGVADPTIEVAIPLGGGHAVAGVAAARAPGGDGIARLGRLPPPGPGSGGTRWWLGYQLELSPGWSLGLRWYAQAAAAGPSADDAADRGAAWGTIGLRHRLAEGPIEWVEAQWRQGLGSAPSAPKTGFRAPPAGRALGSRLSVRARIPLGAAAGFRSIDLEPAIARTHAELLDGGSLHDSWAPGAIHGDARAEWQLGAGLQLRW